MAFLISWYGVNIILIIISFLSLFTSQVSGLKRCFKCRSRGELGSCKDPFLYTNATSVAGVESVPCASGWCGKVLEGGANTFKDEEYGMATERSCLQRGPSDSEERCAPTLRGNTRVMMCFCQGDLCNTATHSIKSTLSLGILAPFALTLWFR